MSHLFTVDNADNRQHRAHTFLDSIFIKGTLALTFLTTYKKDLFYNSDLK